MLLPMLVFNGIHPQNVRLTSLFSSKVIVNRFGEKSIGIKLSCGIKRFSPLNPINTYPHCEDPTASARELKNKCDCHPLWCCNAAEVRVLDTLSDRLNHRQIHSKQHDQCWKEKFMSMLSHSYCQLQPAARIIMGNYKITKRARN